jgi:nitrate reductase NapE component
MFKAMQARGAIFCVFTAAVEKNHAKPKTYTKRSRELKLWSFIIFLLWPLQGPIFMIWNFCIVQKVGYT